MYCLCAAFFHSLFIINFNRKAQRRTQTVQSVPENDVKTVLFVRIEFVEF